MSDIGVIFTAKSALGKFRFLSPAVFHSPLMPQTFRMVLSYIKAKRTIQA